MVSREDLPELFSKFSQQNILIIGDVMIDSYLWGRVDRISPEAPVPVVSLKKRENRLGGAANVALNIQSMGATPLLCSVIGNGEKGDLFMKLLKGQNLPSDGIIQSPNRHTTTKFRIMGNNAQMLRVDEETETPITEDETEILKLKISEVAAKYRVDAIIFEDYDKGVISPTLIEFVVRIAGSKGIPVVVDPKKRNFLHYKGVTLFKPNLKELREGLKIDQDLDTTEAVMEAMQQLQKVLQAKTVLATLSERGICYSTQTSPNQFTTSNLPAHIRNIADVSGAGDTVISVIALCMAAGADMETTARLSNLAGGLVCEYVGVVPVDRTKLLAEATQTFA